jgi:hypothetical protein
MEKIILEQINNLIGNKAVPEDDFLGYVESLLKKENVVCIYESEFTKNANICFNDYSAFKAWWDTIELKKKSLLTNIKMAKAESKNVEEKAVLTSSVQGNTKAIIAAKPVKTVKTKKVVKAKKA